MTSNIIGAALLGLGLVIGAGGGVAVGPRRSGRVGRRVGKRDPDNPTRLENAQTDVEIAELRAKEQKHQNERLEEVYRNKATEIEGDHKLRQLADSYESESQQKALTMRSEAPQQEVGDIIRSARVAQGLTQKELASRCYIGAAQVAKIENGRHDGLEALREIARALKLDYKPPYLVPVGQRPRTVSPHSGEAALLSDAEFEEAVGRPRLAAERLLAHEATQRRLAQEEAGR